MKYSISIKKSALKELRKIPQTLASNILRKIKLLSNNPQTNNVTRLINQKNVHRLRVGDYRVIFTISNNPKTIVIQYIRHRKDAYRFF